MSICNWQEMVKPPITHTMLRTYHSQERFTCFSIMVIMQKDTCTCAEPAEVAGAK
jgi:hypothetical protein